MNVLKLTMTPILCWPMTVDSIAYFAAYYDVDPADIIEAYRIFDDSIDDSVEDVIDLIKDHKEITTLAAIDELLNV